MKFFKYHALGNDYLVIDPKDLPASPTSEQIKRICHRNFGVGSDGILWGPLPSKKAAFALRIFNPDGSEAEKSGNGLRIFSRFLWDQQLVKGDPFSHHRHDSRATIPDTLRHASTRFTSNAIALGIKVNERT